MNYIKENITVTDPGHFSSVLEDFPRLSDAELKSCMMEVVISTVLHANGEVVIFLTIEGPQSDSYLCLFSYLSLQNFMILSRVLVTCRRGLNW
jgi:hypothetical protein